MRRYSSVSKAFECVMNGRAEAPPCCTCSIGGVSTSRKPWLVKVWRRLALTAARARTVLRAWSRTMRSRKRLRTRLSSLSSP